MLSPVFCFFFFQAEDGIRDLTVTGVQTCALPICRRRRPAPGAHSPRAAQTRHAASCARAGPARAPLRPAAPAGDRKSTRLNSSHSQISYAVFCLKKKKTQTKDKRHQATRTETDAS